MRCNDDCLNCKLEKCILDEIKKPGAKKDRSEYLKSYYQRRKEKAKKDNCCWNCKKHVRGKMIRFDNKNFCSLDCLIIYMFDKYEKKMEIVNV